MKSAWPDNATIFRAASKGKIFTRRERENLIENSHLAAQRVALIREERLKIQKEKSAKEKSFKILQAMAENPDQKIKRKRDGTAFIQRRVKGKFQPAEVIA